MQYWVMVLLTIFNTSTHKTTYMYIIYYKPLPGPRLINAYNDGPGRSYVILYKDKTTSILEPLAL